MKDCGGSFHGKHLKAALEYITVPEKTQNGRLVAGVNCQVGSAFEQMRETKRKFNKLDKRQAYHIILSFQEGEASPDTVFELTEKFVKEYLADDFEVVFAVHDNTDHPHSHIVFNSVSFRDGKKYHYKKGDWEREIQPITNRLCEEYGLSTIALEEEPGGRRNAPKEWNEYRDGKFVWSDMVRRDVDACILQAASYEGFLSMMEEKGYELKNAHGEGKYLSAKLPGMKRMIRLKTLGDSYTQESIRRRVREENISQYRRQRQERPRIVYCRIKRYRRAKMSGLQKKYYARLYRIGKLKKKPYSAVWKYKDEIKKMHRLQEEYKFLARHDIHSTADLALVTDSLTGKKKEASAEKSRVYRADHKNKELYEIAGQMRELAECENSFLRGDVFFEEEHKRYQELAAELGEKGYSYEEVAALKEHYHGELARYRELERAVIKEIRLAESVRRNYAVDNDETRGLEQEKKREQKQEMQPKR
jgi:hypothetical protein